MIFKRKKKRAKVKAERQLPSTQDTLKFNSLEEDGIINIFDDWYSKSFKLGDVEYITAKLEDKIRIIDSYADALNILEGGTYYQLLVMNKKITEDRLNKVKYQMQGDYNDKYREEYNKMIEDRFRNNAKAFEVSKYVTIAIDGIDKQQARRELSDISKDLSSHFRENDIPLIPLNGVERLTIFNELLNDDENFHYTYSEIEESELTEKSLIAPNRIEIKENYLRVNDRYTKVMYIRNFPKELSDKLIKNLTNLSFEIVISLNINVYEDEKISKELEEVETKAEVNIINSQKKASRSNEFLSEEFIGSQRDKKIRSKSI